MPGSAVNLQQLLRMQGIVWGDSATHDYHLWIDGDKIYADVNGVALLRADLTVGGRITSTAVGASAKTLLNYVPATLVGTAYPVTTLTGTGNKSLTAFTVTGLPSSAVAADIAIILVPGTNAVGDLAAVYTSTSQTGFPNVEAIITNATYPQAVMSGRTPAVAGASNQLAYAIVTSGTWTLSVQLLGWYEPA